MPKIFQEGLIWVYF